MQPDSITLLSSHCTVLSVSLQWLIGFTVTGTWCCSSRIHTYRALHTWSQYSRCRAFKLAYPKTVTYGYWGDYTHCFIGTNARWAHIYAWFAYFSFLLLASLVFDFLFMSLCVHTHSLTHSLVHTYMHKQHMCVEHIHTLPRKRCVGFCFVKSNKKASIGRDSGQMD